MHTSGLINGLAGLLVAALLIYGCAGKPIGPVDAEGRQRTWKQMDLEQRKTHMKAVVLPQAAELFASWRPERFAQVDCTLCHGQAARQGRFAMPTAHLPRLSGTLLLGPEREKHPDTTQLKLDRLVPMMAEALGKSSFNLITRRGFGCYSCHLGPDGAMYGN